jgi:hypothetical protein
MVEFPNPSSLLSYRGIVRTVLHVLAAGLLYAYALVSAGTSV